MITSIHLKNFKAFEDFTIHIKDFNVLTGPNNNGKSTILDALRVLQAVLRYAVRYNPKLIDLPFGLVDAWGYQIPENSIPITLENIQTNYNTSEPSLIKYKFTEGKSLTVLFHPESPIYLFFESPNKVIRTATDFRKEFSVHLSIVPTLGPLEIEEELLDINYVQRWYGSRRSPRMFRSYWMHSGEHFSEFKRLVETTWPGASISYPERASPFSKKLVMFCSENRMTREICWSGFGFQIWLQLLAHIVNSKDADLIVVDEPEIYLHPDLQHKILDVLKYTGSGVILATHSVEIINSVEPSEVLLIDKKNKIAKRISDLEGLQTVSNILGSGQNIQLTRLARGKKILFVEGKDIKLLARLAKICEFDDLFTSGEITIVPIEGFSQHNRIIHTNWAFTQILGEELKIAVLLDRDYRAEEEIQSVLNKLTKEINIVHIHERKEIENYLIIPSAIEKAINQRLGERMTSSPIQNVFSLDISQILLDITEKLKGGTLSQLIAHKAKFQKSTGIDLATIITKATEEFEQNWRDTGFRLKRVPGKEFFSLLNEFLQQNYKIMISYAQIGNFIKSNEVDSDIKSFFSKMVEFKKGIQSISRIP